MNVTTKLEVILIKAPEQGQNIITPRYAHNEYDNQVWSQFDEPFAWKLSEPQNVTEGRSRDFSRDMPHKLPCSQQNIWHHNEL